MKPFLGRWSGVNHLGDYKWSPWVYLLIMADDNSIAKAKLYEHVYHTFGDEFNQIICQIMDTIE